jgi:DNA-binding NtrC family response regulator
MRSAGDARASAAAQSARAQSGSALPSGLDHTALRNANGRARSAQPLIKGLHPDFRDFVERAASSSTTNDTGDIGDEHPLSLKDWRDLAEAWRIAQALQSCAGNRSAAARELGIGRRTLYAKMEKLRIEPRR